MPIIPNSKELPALNDASLSKKLKNTETSRLSVVLFTSEWCGPCRSQKVVMESLRDTFDDSCSFFLVDCDKSPLSVDAYFIRSVPTTCFIVEGKVVAEIVGAVPREVIAGELKKHLIFQ
jgi:thioredoxin 1